MVDQFIAEAVAVAPARTPAEHVTLALARVSLALRLADRARDDARAAGLDGLSCPTIARRTREARSRLRHLAAGIQLDAEAAGIVPRSGRAA